MLKFPDLIKSTIEFGADFLLGDKEYESGDVVGRSGGFLDKLRGGLKKTMEQGEARGEQQQQLRHRQQPASGVSSQPAFQAERTRLANPLLNNPYAQRALRNLSSRAYANPEMNSIGRELRVAMTRRQGQRTIGVEPARAPRVQAAKLASVRKEPKAVT